MAEMSITIGSLTVYYTLDGRGVHITYAEQGSRAYILDEEEIEEVIDIIERSMK